MMLCKFSTVFVHQHKFYFLDKLTLWSHIPGSIQHRRALHKRLHDTKFNTGNSVPSLFTGKIMLFWMGFSHILWSARLHFMMVILSSSWCQYLQWLQTLFSPSRKSRTGNVGHIYALEYPEPLVHFALCSGAYTDPPVWLFRMNSKENRENFKIPWSESLTDAVLF